MLRTLRFFTLLFAALSLTMESAHVLELPQKLAYDDRLYAAVNTTLYRYFAVIGGPYQVLALVLALVLAVIVRGRRPSFGWTLGGALLLVAAFVAWLTIVAPVNARVAGVLRTTPETIDTAWARLRMRWEMGHAAGFVFQLFGLAALLQSVLVETTGRSGTGEREAGAV